MTDNEKIARWAGWHDVRNGSGRYQPHMARECIPSYSTDAEAIGLLNVLVSKGYEPELSYCSEHWSLNIFTSPKWVVENVWQPTIHQAITAAVLKLIEKEG